MDTWLAEHSDDCPSSRGATRAASAAGTSLAPGTARTVDTW
ncbi:hypothetical protein P935_03191, partial [Mycobacterium tuberculosis KT-0039]